MKDLVLYDRTSQQSDVLLDEIYCNTSDDAIFSLIAFKAFIKENCNLTFLEKSWNKIVEANDSLRLRSYKGKGKKQYIADYVYEKLPVEEVDSEEGFNLLVDTLKGKSVKIVNDKPLYSATLVDCKDGSGGIIVRMHHLCSDGYSIELMFHQLEDCYNSFKNGVEPQIKAGSITDAFISNKKYLKSSEFKEDLKWWAKVYSKQRQFSVPAGRASISGTALSKPYYIDGELYDSLKEFCMNVHSTVPSVLMTTAALTAKELTGKNNFCIHMLTHGRMNYSLKKTVGCMVETIPVFFDLRKKTAFNEAVKRDCANYLDSMRHCRIPFKYHIILGYFNSIRAGFNFMHNWLMISPMGFANVSSDSEIGLATLPKKFLSGIMYCGVFDIVKQKRVTLDMSWQSARFSVEEIDRFMETFFDILKNGLNEK